MQMLQKYNKIPKTQKLLIGIGGVIVSFALFGFLFYSPFIEKRDAYRTRIEELNKEIKINTKKAEHLEKLKVEYKQMEALLTAAKLQLPPEDEISILLKQISDIGLNVGLNFKLWRPKNRIETPGKMYIELPVEVEVEGEYHSVGIFFDRISRLNRIVNISKMKIGPVVRENQDKVVIRTAFDATAFALADETKVEETKKPAPKKDAPKKESVE